MDFPRIKRLAAVRLQRRRRPEAGGAPRRRGHHRLSAWAIPTAPTPPHVVAEAGRGGARSRRTTATRCRAASTSCGSRSATGTSAATTSSSIPTARRSSRSARRKASATWRWRSSARATSCSCPSPTYPIHQYSVIIAGGDLRSIPLMPGEDFLGALRRGGEADLAEAEAAHPELPGTIPTTEVVDLRVLRAASSSSRASTSCCVVHDLAYADLVLRRLRGAELPAGAGRARTSASSSSRCRRATTCRAGASASPSATAR